VNESVKPHRIDDVNALSYFMERIFMTKIYTVDALCGSGKTYAAIRYAIKCATFGEKVAIV